MTCLIMGRSSRARKLWGQNGPLANSLPWQPGHRSPSQSAQAEPANTRFLREQGGISPAENSLRQSLESTVDQPGSYPAFHHLIQASHCRTSIKRHLGNKNGLTISSHSLPPQIVFRLRTLCHFVPSKSSHSRQVAWLK